MFNLSDKNSRRDFLKNTIFVGASLAAGSASSLESRKTEPQKNNYPFFHLHQQGISTPAQKHIYFIVVDLHTNDIEKIKQMFKTWSRYSLQLTQGQNVKAYGSNVYVPPYDTGEADSLNPHNLTLTFGLSPHFFNKLNILQLKPQELVNLPHFPRDQLREHYTGGDICIQACADDPQIAFHAVRNLIRVGRSNITMKWSQSGFNSYERNDTPRNLFGFKDGTANPQGKALAQTVWYDKDNWLKHGSFLIVRRIQMHLETWDRTNLKGQEETFGRHKDTGAPIGEKDEFSEVNLSQKDPKGNFVIPEISHLHLARKTGEKILRRSYSYSSGIDEKTGQFDAGLLFISFQKDPAQFINIQKSLGNLDKMNEYITHIGSGIFACFPGVTDENDYLGKSLFEQI